MQKEAFEVIKSWNIDKKPNIIHEEHALNEEKTNLVTNLYELTI